MEEHITSTDSTQHVPFKHTEKYSFDLHISDGFFLVYLILRIGSVERERGSKRPNDIDFSLIWLK